MIFSGRNDIPFCRILLYPRLGGLDADQIPEPLLVVCVLSRELESDLYKIHIESIDLVRKFGGKEWSRSLHRLYLPSMCRLRNIDMAERCEPKIAGSHSKQYAQQQSRGRNKHSLTKTRTRG